MLKTSSVGGRDCGCCLETCTSSLMVTGALLRPSCAAEVAWLQITPACNNSHTQKCNKWNEKAKWNEEWIDEMNELMNDDALLRVLSNRCPHQALWHLPKYWAADPKMDLRNDIKEFKVACEPWRKWCDSFAFCEDHWHVWKAPEITTRRTRYWTIWQKQTGLFTGRYSSILLWAKNERLWLSNKNHLYNLAQENMGNVSFL